MLSKDECKKIINKYGIKLTNEQLESLIKQLSTIAYLDYELFKIKMNKNARKKSD